MYRIALLVALSFASFIPASANAGLLFNRHASSCPSCAGGHCASASTVAIPQALAATTLVSDPAIRDGVAMQVMGRGAAELAPLLAQGSVGLAKWREEAENNGLIKTRESAAAALALSKAWKELSAVAGSMKGAISAAIASLLTGWAEGLKENVKAAVDWVRAHQPLVRTLFMVGAGAAGLGAGLVTLGKVIQLAGGAFTFATKSLGVLGHILGIVPTILGAILSPMGLLTAAVIGLGVYFFSTTGQLGKAVDWLAGTFGDLLKDAKQALGGIADALSAGNFTLALKVAGSFMKLEWSKMCLWFRQEWEAFKTWFFRSNPEMAKGLINAFASVAKFFSEMMEGVLQVWNRVVHALSRWMVDRAIKMPGSQFAASPHSARGVSPEDGFAYIITGPVSSIAARILLDTATPLTFGPEPMWKQSVEVSERKGTFAIWDGLVKYGPVKLPNAGDWTWGFDCAVENQHVTHGVAHIHDYAPPGKTAKNHKGTIGVAQDGSIEGVEWYFPKFEWWEKHVLEYTGVDAAWALSRNLASSGGKLNAATFRGLDPGNVLFLGGSGGRSETRPGLFEINVRFRGQMDVTGLTVGDITGIAKKAWEYLWVESAGKVDSASAGLVQTPIGVHVEQMANWVDFSQLGINMGPPTY